MLLTGEISDELFGYKYTDFAPSAEAFQKESEKRDPRASHVRRAARRPLHFGTIRWRRGCRSAIWILCAMSWQLTREMKLNRYGKGKYLLRRAFEGTDYLPRCYPLA